MMTESVKLKTMRALAHRRKEWYLKLRLCALQDPETSIMIMESVLARIGADLTLQDDLLVRSISNLLLVIRGTGVITIIIRRFLIIVAAELAENIQLGWCVLDSWGPVRPRRGQSS